MSLRGLPAIAIASCLAVTAVAQDKPPQASPEAGAPEKQPTTAPQPAQPGESAPAAPEAPAAQGAQADPEPAAQPAPAQATPAEPAPQPAAQPPQEPEPAPPQREEPPPPVYGPLGAEPEPEVEEGEWDPWEHAGASDRRHEGFYLRLSIGLGYGMLSGNDHIEREFEDVSLSGAGLATSIGIGGAVADNLILYGDIFQMTLFDPTLERDGREFEGRGDPLRRMDVGDDLRLAGIGIGLAYYFMPANIYLAGSAGFGQAVFEDDGGDVAGSDIGFASNLMLGKEWWVGSDWGLGLAGQFIAVVAEDDIVGDVTGLGFNLMFSATYN